MMFTAKLISTCLGIGYIRKGAGTVAALAGVLAWMAFRARGENGWLDLSIIVLILVLGIWSATMVEQQWGKDSNRVVIDELLGMYISIFLLPVNWQFMAAAFILFRFFDIVKPFYIRRMEKLPSGWGVMADDILAGVYTNLLLQLVNKMDLFQS
jgi:phosphatidylglycerophosphatase A